MSTIDYSSETEFNNSLKKTGSQLGYINSLSPSVDWASLTGGNEGIASFGQSAVETRGQFDTAYGKASNSYDPFPDSGVRGKIDQLQGVYQGIPGAYDISGTIGSLNAARRRNLNVGEQAANTTAQKFQESQLPGSANNIGAGVLRAQSLLPFLKQDSADAVDASKYADSAKQNALSQSAAIANTLANLEQTYTNSLASYNSQKANHALNYANQQSGLGLEASKNQVQGYLDYYKTNQQSKIQAAQLAEQARQANLQASYQNRSLDLNAAQTATTQGLQAAQQTAATNKAPTGTYTTDNYGNVTSGMDVYSALQRYRAGQGTTTTGYLR